MEGKTPREVQMKTNQYRDRPLEFQAIFIYLFIYLFLVRWFACLPAGLPACLSACLSKQKDKEMKKILTLSHSNHLEYTLRRLQKETGK